MRDIYAKRPHQEARVFLMPVFSVRMIYAMADRLLQASLEAKAAKAGRRACDRSAGVV